MAVRTITECDRCHHEIKELGSKHPIIVDGNESDLCGSCHRDLLRYLDGEALEVPP